MNGAGVEQSKAVGTPDPYGLLDEREPLCEHIRARGYGFVYFIGPEAGHGPVKIGWAGHVLSRLGDIQVGNPEPLGVYVAVLGLQRDEREYHERFAADRVRGEWFRLSSGLCTEIVRLRRLRPVRQERKHAAL